MSDLLVLAIIVQWVVLLFMGLGLLLMMRNIGALYAALEAVRIGEPTMIKLVPGQQPPALLMTDATQQPVPSLIRSSQPTQVAIISPGCGPCQRLVQDLAADRLGQAHTVLLSLGTPEETHTLLTNTPQLQVPIIFASYETVKNQWGISGTPTIISLDAQGQLVDYTVGYTSLTYEHVAFE